MTISQQLSSTDLTLSH